jgi:hypothetical protein
MFTVLKMKISIYWSRSNSLIYFYIHVVLNKNWKNYWSEQTFTGLGPEDRYSSWELVSDHLYHATLFQCSVCCRSLVNRFDCIFSCSHSNRVYILIAEIPGWTPSKVGRSHTLHLLHGYWYPVLVLLQVYTYTFLKRKDDLNRFVTVRHINYCPIRICFSGVGVGCVV